ncbi:MAG: NUDIX domain-containing protein [Candidatus Doudnabacteria bacterium]|nr:NUDIX domain-containing protein [Candidatus Doudnabacteria bacterium]
MAFAAKFKDELLECFDEDGSRAHPRYRSEVCVDGTRRWHGTADTWVFNRDGLFICSQRSPAVQNSPNKWQTYSGGHVKAGVPFVETAAKELYEELGIKVRPQDLHLIEKGRSEPMMHVFEHYVILFEGGLKDLRFLDGEVIDAKWYEFEKYKKTKEQNPEKWCCGMTEENYSEIMEWIKSQN